MVGETGVIEDNFQFWRQLIHEINYALVVEGGASKIEKLKMQKGCNQTRLNPKEMAQDFSFLPPK